MADGPFDWVLFDQGGVLVRLRLAGVMQELAGIPSEDEFWSRWLSCQWVRRLERGGCSAEEFAAGIVADWGLPIGPDEMLDTFRLVPDGLYEGAAELVATTRRHSRVGLLSNSNVLHWELVRTRWDLGSRFDAVFLSHEVGYLKPDREIFEHVLSTLDVPAPRVAFIDDNQVNVDAARAAGITAARARGVEEARAALVELGALPQ